MPVLRSQTVYLSITVTLASCRLHCHSNIHSCSLMCLALSWSASRCSCSLVCLALSQHHAALALSLLNCLSITLLLLSHVPCFLSASRCSCSLMCLALSQHHAALALYVTVCALIALSQHHAALALSCALLCLSITSFMCLALSQHAITPLFSALPCPGYSIMSIAPRPQKSKLSIELEFNGCEILDCPMN